MKTISIIFLLLLSSSIFAKNKLTLRDGSILKYENSNVDVVDGLASLGQNLFVVRNKLTKEQVILTTHFEIRSFQKKNAKEPWCTGVLENNICTNTNKEGRVYSIISPTLKQGIGTIHSVIVNDDKTTKFALSILQNISWIK